MSDKLLAAFGLMRCLEYKGELYPLDGYMLLGCNFQMPDDFNYKKLTPEIICSNTGSKIRTIRASYFKAYQAMRCL